MKKKKKITKKKGFKLCNSNSVFVFEDDVGDDLSTGAVRAFAAQSDAWRWLNVHIELLERQAELRTTELDADPNFSVCSDQTWSDEPVTRENAVDLVSSWDASVEEISFLFGEVKDVEFKLLVSGAEIVDELDLGDGDRLSWSADVEVGVGAVLADAVAFESEEIVRLDFKKKIKEKKWKISHLVIATV